MSAPGMTVSDCKPASRRRRFEGGSTGEQTFRPFDDDDGDEHAFDEHDDRPITDSRVPVWVMTPPTLVVGGLLSLVFGGFVGILPLVTLGVVSMVVGAVTFAAVPVVRSGWRHA